MGHINDDESEEEIPEETDRLCEIEQVFIKEETGSTNDAGEDEENLEDDDEEKEDDDDEEKEDDEEEEKDDDDEEKQADKEEEDEENGREESDPREIELILVKEEIIEEENAPVIPTKKVLKCSWEGCTSTFAKTDHLKKHLRSHTGERPYKCTFDNCEKAYTSRYNLKKHKVTHCSDYAFDLDEEAPVKRPKKVHRCTFEGCDAKFSKKDRFEGHIRQHKGERPFKCTIGNCDKAYATNPHLKRHLLTHSSVATLLFCDICSLGLSNRQNLIRHIKRVHKSNRLYCAECNQTFRKKANFAEHMTLIHSGEMVSCDKCHRKFKTQFLLTKHQRGHQKMYDCDRDGCTKSFIKFIELRRHKQNDHVTEHKCPECQKTFLSRSQVRLHQRVHTSSLIPCPYDMCHKVYLYQSNLDLHIRVKHRDIQVFCDICKMGFMNKPTVRRHIQTAHMGRVKPARKKKEKRDKRFDAGRSKQSMVGKLCGVQLPVEEDKNLLTRSPKIRLIKETFSSPKDQ